MELTNAQCALMNNLGRFEIEPLLVANIEVKVTMAQFERNVNELRTRLRTVISQQIRMVRLAQQVDFAFGQTETIRQQSLIMFF